VLAVLVEDVALTVDEDVALFHDRVQGPGARGHARSARAGVRAVGRGGDVRVDDAAQRQGAHSPAPCRIRFACASLRLTRSSISSPKKSSGQFAILPYSSTRSSSIFASPSRAPTK